jgi:hypothetical protein
MALSLSQKIDNLTITTDNNYYYQYTRMLTLYDDIIIKIADELSDKQKIYVSLISKQFDRLKFKMIYTKLISLSKIISLPYFDKFENILLDVMNVTYPTSSKFICFLANGSDIPQKITHLTFGFYFNNPINNCIPSFVTHLTFGYYFNQPINDCIPSSVTHLSFGWFFDQSINNCIPSSVTHLTFGGRFNQSINNCIPSSVTYLTFGWHFNQPINDCIPFFVTHLIFGYNFNQSINNCIPPSVTHLSFGYNFNQQIKEIPTSVKKIIIEESYVLEIDEKVKSHAEIVIS